MASTPPGGRGRGSLLMLLLLLIVLGIAVGWAWLKNPPGTATPSATGSPPTQPADPPAR